MNDDNFGKREENKLDALLKERQPKVPGPKSDEKQRIMRAVLGEERKPVSSYGWSFPSRWFFPSTAVAAALAITLWIGYIKKSDFVVTDEGLESYIMQTMGAYYNGNFEQDAFEEDWLFIAEATD